MENVIYCPKDQTPLTIQKITNIHLAFCPTCQGAWYYGETLSRFLSVKTSKDIISFSKRVFQQSQSSLSCPECHTEMVAKTFQEDQSLTIDQCHHCQGIWLDKGELGKTKQLLRKYTESSGTTVLGQGPGFLRAYPVPKSEASLPVTLHKLPRLDLGEEERDEKAEEAELASGTEAAEVTTGIWLFTFLTGLPIEAYNPPRKRVPYVTIGLLVLNTLIFILMTRMGNVMSIFTAYGAVPEQILNKQNLLALLTHAFLHAGFAHWLGNMYFLWTFGDNVEDRLGHVQFLFFYLFCAVTACLCQVWVMMLLGQNSIPLVGASGAIAGVMGAYLYFFPKAAMYQNIIIVPVKIPITLYLGFWVAMQFVGHYLSKSGVAWWAHLGGFFIGLIIAAIWYHLRKQTTPVPAA